MVLRTSYAKEVLIFKIHSVILDSTRARILKHGSTNDGPVLYWMSRDQRVQDNWALIYSANLSIEIKKPLVVVFTLTSYPSANLRHYDFMLKGLIEVESNLANQGIPFHILFGDPVAELQGYIQKNYCSILVSDFDPIKIKREWKEKLNQGISIPHHEVDAHNIVPCWVASNKLEFGAYTIRPKILKLLNRYLTEFDNIKPFGPPKDASNNWESIKNQLYLNSDVMPVDWILPGEEAAMSMLRTFIANKLNGYSTRRNDPGIDGQSNLSPYLHFGQLSAQRVAIEITKAIAPEIDKKAFLEELIIRRELSDNFCYYNNNYDSILGFHDWAKKSLQDHCGDEREYNYSLTQLESANTHDELWNSAQTEMVITGKMHGYMRMYWAKKILEWSSTPEEAIKFAIYLNDKYGLDGRDPNGYAGIAWSIGGVHDRAWGERPVFGKIRYMNYNGCKRKFDVQKYITLVNNLNN